MVRHTLVVLTPLRRGDDHSVVRIDRLEEIDESRLLFIAGGPNAGIIVRKFPEDAAKTMPDPQQQLSFSVWLKGGTKNEAPVEEVRTLRFRFFDSCPPEEFRAIAHQFLRQLLANLPLDYVSLIRQLLQTLQTEYAEIASLELDLKKRAPDEAAPMPDPKQYDSGSEVESVTAGHVQDVLEQAYPNGLTAATIADALRCSEEEVDALLADLEQMGVARRVGNTNEWIRGVDVESSEQQTQLRSALEPRGGLPSAGPSLHPTVAIICCLFAEKQAVDSVVDGRETIHKYRSGGDSNVYTLGWIGTHRAVATKLAVIGDSREAVTSAGSITTRLLGNYQHVEHVLIVGCGGSVPHYTEASQHARLGDVVVAGSDEAPYVFAHDALLDRKTDGVKGFAVRRWRPASGQLAEIAARIGRDERALEAWDEATNKAQERLQQLAPDQDFSRPAAATDVLALRAGVAGNMVVVPHPEERERSLVHVAPIGAVGTIRKPLGAAAAVDTSTASSNAGNTTGGGDEDERAQKLRERFAADEQVRALDAGFDSVVAAVVGSRVDSWALLRGVADYQHGQTRASKTWQAYAALRAATLAQMLVERLEKA